MTETVDWGPIRALARRVLTEGERLALMRKEKALLKRTAAEVGISASEVKSALATEEGALGLLQEESRRIREGTRRLMDALHRMYQHKDKGDFVSARQEMRDVLAVEVVPHYRAIAQGQLEAMADEPQQGERTPDASTRAVFARRTLLRLRGR
ncbi:DUSAM domain-containing protein [Myxococcus virescens]|uniref:DUSAM domain-containing protein n=1 Tax=Myxococcus virescens TaxID=83456 RepID=UPI003DA5B552